MLVFLIFKVSDKWLNIDTTEEKIKYELNILLGVQSNELFLLTIDIFSVIQYWRMDDDHHVLFIMITSITIITISYFYSNLLQSTLFAAFGEVAEDCQL